MPLAAPHLKILLIEDSQADAALALHMLERGGVRSESVRVDTEPAFRRELARFAPQIILSDFSMPGFDGLSALGIAREAAADVPFIFVSGTIGEENAIRALQNGATDYVLKNNLLRLPAAVDRALREAETRVARRRAEERLVRLAQFDELTGLPNRRVFMDRLGVALAQSRRYGWRVGAMFIDLDDFKTANDAFGHAAGDKLLAHVAQCLSRAVREGDTVARIGGDEFGAILPMLTRPEDSEVVARGIAISPWDGQDADSLLRAADLAMYLAKRHGGGRHRFYDPEMTLPPRRAA
jgi:PleD family two-component response regulator